MQQSVNQIDRFAILWKIVILNSEQAQTQIVEIVQFVNFVFYFVVSQKATTYKHGLEYSEFDCSIYLQKKKNIKVVYNYVDEHNFYFATATVASPLPFYLFTPNRSVFP